MTRPVIIVFFQQYKGGQGTLPSLVYSDIFSAGAEKVFVPNIPKTEAIRKRCFDTL